MTAQTPAAPSAPIAGKNAPPPFSVGEQPIHFGYLVIGRKFTTEVTLRNESTTESFTISKVTTGCTCTTVTVMNEVVPPGGETTLVIDHDPEAYVHGWTKRISILTNERPDQWYTFITQASCGYAVRINPGASQWVLQPKGNLLLKSYDDRPFRVLSVHGKSPVIQDFNPESDAPRNEYIVKHDLGEQATNGMFGVALVIETDHPEAPMIALRIGEKSMRRIYEADPPSWRPEEEYLLFGSCAPGGEWIERTFTLKRTRVADGVEIPDLTLAMSALEPGDPAAFEVELVSVEKSEPFLRGDYVVTARFRALEGASPGFVEEVLMISQGAQFTQMPVYGRVGDPPSPAAGN